MAIILPNLPYNTDALAPAISKETIEYHYGKHHQAYVTNLNKLVQGSNYQDMHLEKVLLQAEKGSLLNNAAQVWNHTFYWQCLNPHGGGQPVGKLAAMIDQTFGGIEKFRSEFTRAALTLFGSGWVWLVRETDQSLKIVQTSNAGCPLRDRSKPVLTCDVWEHAYYIDYRNARPKYLEAFWSLVDWKHANDCFVEK